jgi:hypothetical protein
LVLALRRDVLRSAQLLAQAAGLKLAGLVPRAYGLIAATAAASPPPDPTAAVAVLALTPRGGEFLVARGDQLLFARPIASPALASDATLLGEVRRSLAVYSGQSPQAPVRGVYVAEGGSPPGVTDRFRDTLAVPVHALNPPGVAPGVPAGAVAAVYGTARAMSAGAMPINFVKPREPKPPADPHRRPILLGAALAAVIVLGLGSLAWTQLSARDAEIARLRGELNGLDQTLSKTEPDAKRWDEVKRWMDGGVVWLDELYDLAAEVPDNSKMRIVQFTADPIALPANAPPGRRHHVGRVTLRGLVTEDPKTLTQFMNELVKTSAYRVEPKSVARNTMGIEQRTFSQQFSTRYELEKRPPSAFTRQFVAEPPERRQRGRGGPGDAVNFLNLLPGAER